MRKDDDTRFTLRMSKRIFGRLRSVVLAEPGLTLRDLIEESFVREIKRRERLHGRTFRPTTRQLPPGRPRKKVGPTA